MKQVADDILASRLSLAEELRTGRDRMHQPQDFPVRYGSVIHGLDRLLKAADCAAVVGGGWATWHHGFVERVTQDVAMFDRFIAQADEEAER